MIFVSHALPVNVAGEPQLDRAAVWDGLVLKANNALPFVPSMTYCEVTERYSDTVFDRDIDFRGERFTERITLERPHRVTFTRIAGPVLGTIANEIEGDGDDLRLRFSFNTADFAQRVCAAAYRLGLVDENELDEEETDDLVELTADGVIEEPRSELGRYLVRHWERLSLVEGESLVYWLRKLVFRGAWLDHRVKDGRLDVTWDEGASEFAYLEPGGERALLELAPTPSWHELQFRR